MLKNLVADAWFHLKECITLSSTLIVSVLAGLLYFYLKGKDASRELKFSFTFIALGLVLLVCPVTASVLRLVTGVYYDSQDMWNILPLIPFGAFTCTLLITELIKKKDELHKGTCLISALCLAAAVLVCGRLGTEYASASTGPEEITASEKQVAQYVCEGSLTIFAPDTITAYVHIYSGKVRTLYGRDMWDGRLTKNRFGTYSDDVRLLHEDMKKIMTGDVSKSAAVCHEAFELGADVCIMPEPCREALSEDPDLLTEEFIASDGTEFILVRI